jgi:hypothetical protein
MCDSAVLLLCCYVPGTCRSNEGWSIEANEKQMAAHLVRGETAPQVDLDLIDGTLPRHVCGKKRKS